MKVTIISVGKIKEKYLEDGINEYLKRLSKYASVDVITIKDEPIRDNMKDEDILDIEGKRIIEKIPSQSFVILLDLKGQMIDSITLADKIKNACTYQASNITFIIGGSLGLSNLVRQKSDFKWCFSLLTFPHQLIRFMLLEQIYRAFKIINNETYHK